METNIFHLILAFLIGGLAGTIVTLAFEFFVIWLFVFRDKRNLKKEEEV